MIVGVVVFILGIAFGGAAVVVNQRMVDYRTEKLRRRNEKLLEKIHVDRIEYERSRAYRRGFCEGEKAAKAKTITEE